MGSGGLTTFASLMNKVKHYQDRLHSKKSRLKNLTYATSKVKTEYNFGTPTEKELEIIKANIRSRAKIERMKVFTFTIIALILVFFLGFTFL